MCSILLATTVISTNSRGSLFINKYRTRTQGYTRNSDPFIDLFMLWASTVVFRKEVVRGEELDSVEQRSIECYIRCDFNLIYQYLYIPSTCVVGLYSLKEVSVNQKLVII